MRNEIKVQWELFRATGLPCAFVNSHHHLQAHPFVYKALLDILPAQFEWVDPPGQTATFHAPPGKILFGIADKLFMEPRRRRCPYRHSDTMWGLAAPFACKRKK